MAVPLKRLSRAGLSSFTAVHCRGSAVWGNIVRRNDARCRAYAACGDEEEKRNSDLNKRNGCEGKRAEQGVIEDECVLVGKKRGGGYRQLRLFRKRAPGVGDVRTTVSREKQKKRKGSVGEERVPVSRDASTGDVANSLHGSPRVYARKSCRARAFCCRAQPDTPMRGQ